MATGVRVLACEVVIAFLLYWISATQGSRISAPCTLDNCTSTRIGDPCSNPADCLAITNSQCRNDTCQCISGYMPKNESQECVLRTISDQCEIDSDCSDAIDNSYCHGNRICRCRDGYLLEGSNCVARKLDDECDKQSDCTEVMNNTRCLRKKCECINLYLREGNDTCRLRRLGDNCNKTIQCNPKEGQFRACLNGLCVCAKGYRRTPNDDGEFNCVKVTLGSTCSSKANCSHIPNSACVKRKCSCASGYTDVVGVSCRPLLLGDPCRLDSDCMMAHAVCSNKTCSCMKGFAVSNGSSQCTKMIVGDTECNTSEDCLNHFPNTACDSMGLCQCERQYYLNRSGSECLFRYVGDACSNDGECLYSVNSTECNNNICKCIDTHLTSGNKTDCTLKNLGGRPCTTDAYCSQLVPHSSCDVDNSRTCFCNIGYYSNENFDECLEKRLSDPCLSDADCNTTNPNTVCSESTNRCECSPEFAPKFPETVKNASKPFCSIRKIGDQSCQTKEECSSAIANSTCGSCVDAPGGSPCLQRCSESSNVTEAPETSTSSSRCPEQTCICERGFVAESEGERCERRKLRGNCSVDEDCNILIPNSVCFTGFQVCYCAPGFLEDGIYVCTRRKIDDICLKQSDCQAAVPSSYCYRYISTDYGFCKCNSGYQVINAGTECRKRQIGDRTCQNETDCSDAINNSNCHHQMCICNIGYYRSFDHTQCIKRKLFDDYCDDNRDCSAVIPNAVCDDLASRRCICPSGYYANNGTECKKRNINDTCQPGVMTDCSDAVTNSTCVNGVCKCVSGFFAIGNDTCVRRKINDSNSNCENLHDCADAVENSSCENGMCLCDRGYYSSGGGTVCLQRQLNDTCNVTQDCSSVIPRSICHMGRCKCEEGFDVHDNSSRCVLRPTQIGEKCYFVDQCRIVIQNSTCSPAEEGWTCVCLSEMFTAVDNRSCIKYPEKLGDFCQKHEHCYRNLSASKCELKNNTCVCLDGYIQKTATSCVEKPLKLGDFCLEDVHCNMVMNNSKCEQNTDNSTCVCEYGYRQGTRQSCVERDRLPQYEPINGTESVTCQADKCTNWTNSRCEEVKGMPDRLCRCDYRHALPFNSTQCVPIQTYELDLSLTREAGIYDYLPLEFMHEYSLNRTPIYTKFADRVSLSGLMMLFNKSSLLSPLRDRFVASEVVRFQNLSTTSQATGVRAKLLLHLTANYMDATPTEDIYNFIEECLNGSGGLLGQSALKVATPYSDAVVVRDYDECEAVNASDCSDHATCINTLGSFMCVCNYRYEDLSKIYNRRPGRVCNIPSTTDETSDLCSSDDCKTRWEFVGLAVTLFLLIVMAFITYEIIQRKKTFTARKLYEKFGTTKIRKLRQASMQRLHERKKRKIAETKIKKEEEKQKKEELKREKSQKKRLKDEERKTKQEEKKQKDLEKKETNRAKQAKSSDDVEWLGEEEEERQSPSPTLETAHPAPSDDSPSSSLPGSVNGPETEMTFPKIVTSPIEESNV